MGRSRYSITEPDKPHFLTCNLMEWLPLFTTTCWAAAHKQDRVYQLWQEGSHAEMVFSESVMRQKLEHLHNNPVKRGYVELPEHWRYSRARNYAGMGGLIEIQRWF